MLKRLLAPSKGLFIGKKLNSFLGKEFLSESELNHHVHIVGASGFGKTVLLTKILKDQIKKGHGALWLDMKGDRDSIESMIQEVNRCNRSDDLKIFSLSHPEISDSYNLLGAGNASEILDRIMSSLNWSEEYYKNYASSYLLKLLTVLVYLRDRSGVGIDLFEVYKGLTQESFLLTLSEQIPKDDVSKKILIEELYRLLSRAEASKNLSGLISQIEGLILTEFGNNLKHSREGIDLFNSVREGKIIFIFLDSRRYKESAKSLGRMVIKDLIATSARIDDEVARSERKQFVCFIDEFSDIAQEDFTAFPDRARSSRMSLVLSHQDISDLKKVSDTFQNRIMANTATTFAFLQSNQESAEAIAQRAGTRTVWKETIKADNYFGLNLWSKERSLREVEEYVVHPNRIKRLTVGECVVVKKYPYSRASVIRVEYDE